MSKYINRGMVHIIKNEQGTIYQADDEGTIWIQLRQIELHCCNGEMLQIVKTAFWNIDLLDTEIDRFLPGNIYEYISTEPITNDPIDYLWWENGEVKKNIDGNTLWRKCTYIPEEQYQAHGELVAPV